MSESDKIRGLERRVGALDAELVRANDRHGTEIPRPATGGGGMSIKIVKALPAIPFKPTIVWWTSEDDGTGDDQLWASAPGETIWWPLMKFTLLIGSPAT